jgi:hypothetical protein
MVALRLAPFADLSTEDVSVVRAEPWQLNGDALVEPLVAWAYTTPFRLHRSVTLNNDELSERCKLRKNAPLKLATAWVATGAVSCGRAGPAEEFRLTAGDTSHQIELNIPSSQLAHGVRVHLALVCCEQERNGAQPGSILWRDQQEIGLDSARPRLTIVPTSFEAFSAAERNAAWTVITSPGWLDQHPSVGVVVYLNVAKAKLVSALSSRKPTAEDAALQSMFFHDVGRTLVERALRDDAFVDGEFERGTMGASLAATLNLMFAGASRRQIRGEDPGRMERLLQHRHSLLGELK